MKKQLQPITLISFFFPAIFIITQITGILLSVIICFILNDFTWQFIHAALINSFILGAILVANCTLTQKIVLRVPAIFIYIITTSILFGVAVISVFLLLLLEPALFVYYNRGAISFLFINFLFTIALQIICISSIIYKEIMIDKEKAIGNERDLRNQMEMQLLSSRVNPHFLFNTLNMIITLLKHPQKAELALLNLSDLLRENLDISGRTSILLSDELDNVRKYLELQALRFGDKLTYTITCNTNFPIPPLIIQPLVENCIKHNMQHVSSLNIDITVLTTNKTNTITIIDSVKALDESMINSGHGLTITKKRVENSKGTFTFVNGGVVLSFCV